MHVLGKLVKFEVTTAKLDSNIGGDRRGVNRWVRKFSVFPAEGTRDK